MTPPDEIALIHRRVIQLVGILSVVAAIAGAGVYGGRLISTLDALSATVTRLNTQMEAQATERAADRYEVRALRERVDRLERAIAP